MQSRIALCVFALILLSSCERQNATAYQLAATGTLPDRPFKVTGEIKPPVLLSRVEPQIPPNARCRGLVQFTTVIDTEGNVTRVKDVTPNPDAFTQAYARAVEHYRYR